METTLTSSGRPNEIQLASGTRYPSTLPNTWHREVKSRGTSTFVWAEKCDLMNEWGGEKPVRDYIYYMLEEKSEVRICENVTFVLFYIPWNSSGETLLSATAASFTRLYHSEADV